MKDPNEHIGYTFYKEVKNLAELMAYMDTHNGDMPDCEAFRELREGDEELIAGKGYIAQEPFGLTQYEWYQLPKTLRIALGLDGPNQQNIK